MDEIERAIKNLEALANAGYEHVDDVDCADILLLISELRAARTREADARKKIEVLSMPNIVGLNEAVYYAEVDYDGLIDEMRQIPEPVWELDWANRDLGQWFAARIESKWDEDGGAEDGRIKLYPSRQSALDAVNAWRSAKAEFLALVPTPDSEPA